jgi:hypothetical protein
MLKDDDVVDETLLSMKTDNETLLNGSHEDRVKSGSRNASLKGWSLKKIFLSVKFFSDKK